MAGFASCSEGVGRNGPYWHLLGSLSDKTRLSEELCVTLGSVPIVGDVRGSHFMLCMEFVKDRDTRDPFAGDLQIGRQVARAAQSRGLIIRPIGNLAVLSPTLILTRQQIDRIVAILSESLDAVVADLTRQGVAFAA